MKSRLFGPIIPLVVLAIGTLSCGGLKITPLADSTEDSDLFLFLGDNIYADTEDMAVMRQKYEKLFANKNLRKLLRKTPIMATWDDHDYGVNDGGVDFAEKEGAKEEFINAFYALSEFESDLRSHAGIYHSNITGPVNQRVQVIMLDTRSFRSDLTWLPMSARAQGRYMPDYNPDAQLLGEAQWDWLEGELKKPAQLRILVTSIQAIPDNHGWEKWGNLPLERDRLFQMIQKTKAKGVVLVSGDRHLSEISRLEDDDPKGIDYPLYEITASSLNRPSGFKTVEQNQHRITDENVRVENFGLIEIDWAQSDPALTFHIKDIQGASLIEHSLRLSELQ